MEIPQLFRETRYGMPTADQILPNRNYLIGYSYLFRQPRWAMQVIDQLEPTYVVTKYPWLHIGKIEVDQSVDRDEVGDASDGAEENLVRQLEGIPQCGVFSRERQQALVGNGDQGVHDGVEVIDATVLYLSPHYRHLPASGSGGTGTTAQSDMYAELSAQLRALGIKVVSTADATSLAERRALFLLVLCPGKRTRSEQGCTRQVVSALFLLTLTLVSASCYR